MCKPDSFGADPVIIKWKVVRGDTSPLRVEFLEDDEVTFVDTTGWEFNATTYDKKTDILDILDISAYNGYVDIVAPPSITEYWGTGYSSVVSELMFDLQVKIDETIWTPVIGTISVMGDVTGGSL